MTIRKPIDPGFHGQAFSTAAAQLGGLTRAQLRQPVVRHPYHGVNVIEGQADPLRAHLSATQIACREYSARMLPGQFFAGSTAALVWQAPLTDRFEERPLVVGVIAPRTPPRTHGVQGIKVVEGRARLRTAFGFALVSPPDAWCQLAGELSREELVAVGDYLISGNPDDGRYRTPLATRLELADAVDRHARGRGAQKLRWALARVREGVDSRPESLLRLMVVAAGLPEPLVNDPTPVQGGSLTLRPDLKFPQWRVALEYEGENHWSDRRQWARDQRRRELLEEAGWKVIRVFAADVFGDPVDFIARLVTILRARGYRG
ncbi:endonuclease domain-containing protein [Gryllotalpicola protaetiae]|uniref:DUF559 domain-containing protein n=1 Tax=Gryllotalpicola protaetiae TaxID=2419771 RepID=A0A387BPQ3_9MICO|nr:hypothetical protein [Gryllotalpicola protaetiae]AYG04462.1 hypothetical protein D7I44_13600 [Gryllotalpicola protaetiae]